MPFMNGRRSHPANDSEFGAPRKPLSARAEVVLDIEPLRAELQQCTEPLRESIDSQREVYSAVKKLAEQQALTTSALQGQLREVAAGQNQLNEFNLAFQKSLQEIEALQQSQSEQQRRESCLRPLAKRVLGLWSTIRRVSGDDTFFPAVLLDELQMLLEDFGVELIVPDPFDPFDPSIMKPKSSPHRGTCEHPVVATVECPGARHGEWVLVYAIVEIQQQPAVTTAAVRHFTGSTDDDGSLTSLSSEKAAH